MNRTVWLIGGTKDSVLIADKISTFPISLIVTVATPEATHLYRSKINTMVGCMNREAMAEFCVAKNITAIIDASHPFAVEVSQNAIATANNLAIPYLRYERDTCDSLVSDSLTVLDSFATLLEGDYLIGKRVLLTVGCKVLPQFRPFHDKSILFARVLPKLNSLQTALKAGFSSDRIIAFRPPITPELEIALWRQWNISLVVTKASGKPGGEDTKQQVAKKLGIPLIAIARPTIGYPQQTTAINDVVMFVEGLSSREN